MVEETLGHSLSELEAFLEELPALLEFQPGRIVLGGFSQGATTRMAMAISRPDLVAAVIGFSGFLAESVKVPFSALSPGTPPIFWGHGLLEPQHSAQARSVGPQAVGCGRHEGGGPRL